MVDPLEATGVDSRGSPAGAAIASIADGRELGLPRCASAVARLASGARPRDSVGWVVGVAAQVGAQVLGVVARELLLGPRSDLWG